MGWTICKVDDKGEERFLVWSSIVDAPISFPLTKDEFVEFLLEDARMRAREDAARMLARTSDLADVLCVNRAGPGESRLTEDEVMEFYVRRKKEPTRATLTAYRAAKKKKGAREK
jgi:hypothetical protein